MDEENKAFGIKINEKSDGKSIPTDLASKGFL